jgi:hypothetical protein
VTLFVYVDSYIFVVSTAILQAGVGLTGDTLACKYAILIPVLMNSSAIFMCVLFYFSTKVNIVCSKAHCRCLSICS